MSLPETLFENWKDINSRKLLNGCLVHAICRLRLLGHTELAKNWDARRRNMPTKIGAEAINIVLMAACLELLRLKIVVKVADHYRETMSDNMICG